MGKECVQVSSRRSALSKVAGAAVALAVSAPPAGATVGSCKPGANNCQAGTWTAPAEENDAAATLKAVIEAYPQAGQADVDGGGWKMVSEGPGSFNLEYYSSGKGNFAKFLNGGKPFIDDLSFEVSGASVAFKSSSRVGDSDFGVNAKRLNYIAAALRAKGWDAKPIKV